MIAAGDRAEVRRRDPPLLTCHVAALRRWSACLDLDRLAAKLAAGKLPRRHLAFDLDVTRISPDGADAGRMHDRREGHETHPAHAARVHAAQVPDALGHPALGHPAVGTPALGHPALAWSGAAPRICLERYRLSAGHYVVDGLACHVTGGARWRRAALPARSGRRRRVRPGQPPDLSRPVGAWRRRAGGPLARRPGAAGRRHGDPRRDRLAGAQRPDRSVVTCRRAHRPRCASSHTAAWRSGVRHPRHRGRAMACCGWRSTIPAGPTAR